MPYLTPTAVHGHAVLVAPASSGSAVTPRSDQLDQHSSSCYSTAPLHCTTTHYPGRRSLNGLSREVSERIISKCSTSYSSCGSSLFLFSFFIQACFDSCQTPAFLRERWVSLIILSREIDTGSVMHGILYHRVTRSQSMPRPLSWWVLRAFRCRITVLIPAF